MTELPEDFEYIEEPDNTPDFIAERLAQEAWVEIHSPHYLLDVTSGRVARPPWLFEDFLLSQSITLISGEPFAGKTMLLAAMLLSLDSGEPLANSFQPAPRQRVLFVGQDAPTWDYLAQVQKIARGHEITMTHGSMMLINKGFDLMDPASLKLLEEALELFSINVLMLDTLLELHNLDENLNTEMKKVMGCLKYLRDKHYLSIIATTHTAKAKDGSPNYRIRGASVIAGSVDQHILLRPHFVAGHPNGFYLKVPKSRGGKRPDDAQVIRFISGETSGKESIRLEYAGELYSERQALVLDQLKNGPIARKEIALVLRQKYPQWSDAELQRRTTNTLAYLEQKGLVRKVERGIYTLAESPQPKAASNPA